MDFCSMTRKELQTLCKKNGIPANLSNVEMAARLAAIQKVKQQKMFKSCLKNLQIVVCSDGENDRVKIRGRKRVKFSPENETFEFEKTDPRELRLLARKRRSMAKSELGKNPVLVSGNSSNEEDSVGNLVAECKEVGTIEEVARRNLRRKSLVKSNAVFVSQDLTNVANVENGNKGRSWRSHSRKAEQKNVEITLLSPCVEKKAKRGRKYDEIVEGGVVERVDRPPDKIADHIGNTHMATRISLRSRGNSAAVAAGVLERSKLVEKDLNKKSQNISQFPRRSVRLSEKAKGGDLTSVSKRNAGDKLSNEDAAQNHTENCVETALDSRKRKSAGKKAASGKNQSFEEVSHGFVDQQNGNVENPVNDKAFVGRRLRSRQVVSEGLDKDVGEVKLLVDGRLTRKSIQRRVKNDEKDESYIPAEAARQFTRPRGKVKFNASLSGQLADDVPQSADIMYQSDNQRAQLVNKESEARDGLMEKAAAVMADGSSSEQTMPDGPGRDHSVEEKINNKVEEQYHATLGFASTEQKTEKSDVDVHICTSIPRQLCVAYDTRRPEDHIGSNDSDEKAPANVRADTCSTARSGCPVLPLLQKSSDCEAECSAEVNNNLDQVDDPLRLHVAAVDDVQEGIISTPGSISASKFSVSLAAKKFADVSETVFHSPAKPATPVERAVFNADYEQSFSRTDLGDRKMGSEKVTSNKRDRLFNRSRNEKLSKQISRLEESSIANEENMSENAIKNQVLDDPAVAVRNIDEQVIDQEEAAGAREICEIVSRKTECTTPEVFHGEGLNKSVSQVKGLVGGEVSSEVNAQHCSALDRSTLSAGALLANMLELTEEDEETKTVTSSYNRVGGTSSRSTDEGDLTAALSLLKKGEESSKEMLEDVACFQKRGKQNYVAESDEVTRAKQLVVADGFAHPTLLSLVFKEDVTNHCENMELESERAAVVSNSNKDVDAPINESSECFSIVSGKTKYLEQSSGNVDEGHEADTSSCGNESRNPFRGKDREPLQANWVSYAGNLISGSDVKSTRSESLECNSVTKRVILADMPEISFGHDKSANLRSRSSTLPLGVLDEEVHKISQVEDNSVTETEETSQSSEILRDSFAAKECYELECTVENADVLCCKSAMVNETVSKLFTDDIHNASENPGERKLGDAAITSGTGCEGLCSIPFSVLYLEPDYESAKIDSDMDQGEAKDSVCPVALQPQAVVHNEKVTNEIEERMQDALHVRCLPSLDDCIGTNNVNVAPEETKHGEVNNSEDACITKSPGNLRRLPYGEVNNSEDASITKSPGNLQQSPRVFAEVSDALIDPGMCNSEEVEFARDQGNTEKAWQNVNEELLGSHVHNVDKAAFLIANDHLASERPGDLQCSTAGLDGMHFALGHDECEEDGSQACGVDIEELRASKSLSPAVLDDKGNELDSTGDKLIALPCKLTSADEKPLEAKMNDMHDIPADADDQKLSEATNIREMGYHVICSSLSSLINGETYYVHAKGDHNADKTEAHDIVCHAVLEPLSFGRNEKPIHEIEGTLRDASEIGCAPLLEDSLAKSKDDAALKERELKIVKSSENAWMTRSDESASERQHDLRSSSCVMADVSDVIDHGKVDASEDMEVEAEIDYKLVKGNYAADQAVTHDVFYPAMSESQSFGENEKAMDQTGRSLHDASENGCAPLLVDSHGIGKDNVASKESELCEVRNSGDACMTSSDHLASERRKDLLRSSSGTAEVSDVVMDHEKVDNSEAVDANRDQGNSTIGQQNMNGGQIDVPLQEKASATQTDHLAFKVSADLRSSLCGDDGICSVQHSDCKQSCCLAKVEEQQLCESVAVVNHCDAEDVGRNSAMVDEKTLQVLMNNIHSTTEIFSEKELVEAATIREVGCGDLHSSPFSIINWEANTEGAHSVADQAGTKDILYPAVVELEPQLSGGYEKVTERVEEASEDTSAVRSSPLIAGFSGTSKLDVVLKENEHGDVHSLEDDSLIGSDGLAFEKPEDVHSVPFETAEVSDVIEHGESNSSEVVPGADQALNSSYDLELNQHILFRDDNRKKGHIVVSMKRVVEILPPSQLINLRNSGAVRDLHGNTGSPGDHKLFDAAEVNELAQKAVSNYPCSTPNLETSYDSFKGNSESALETLEEDSTPVDMHDQPLFKMPENGEVLFKDLEDRCLNTVEHSVAENCSIVKSKEGDHAKVNPVEFAEMCHFAANHFSNLSEMGTETILGGRDNDDDNSNKAGTFSPSLCAFDNVTDPLQDQNASPSMSGSQRQQSAESVSAAHAGSTSLLECKDQTTNLDSCMFSSWEIDLIWGNMTANNNSGNMQQPVTEHIVSGTELADGHMSCPTHRKTEEIEERNGTEHEVADDQAVNQEIQPAEEQLIELKLLLNSSRENPEYPGGNMNETSRAGKHPNCVKNSGEVPHNAKDFPAINHADSKVTKSSMIKSKKSRSILIHGTPQKQPLFIHDMKENTQGPKARQMIDVTAVKPLLKRKALEDLQK